jgi:hypothetical protein
MNFLKKGPDLKLSDLKVPDFILDVYYDLKERHLLPLAAILIVAIVAVPIALSQSSEPEAASPAPAAAAGVASTSAGRHAGELVAKSAPGLRDYRRRLAHLQATDPFKQQYPNSEGSSPAAAGGSEGESGGSAPSEEAPSTAPIPPETTEGRPVPGKLTYYSYAIDVRVSSGGSEASAGSAAKKPTVRRNLPELTMLPNRATPAAIYMGSTKDGKKAVMLVSSDVDAVFGDAKCVLGSQTCELLVMETGVPETFVYGGAGRTFTVELLKIHLVATDKLNRAPLGEPKKPGK